MATRASRKIDACTVTQKGGCLAPFLSILCNNVKITGRSTESAPPLFIVKTLVERGGIAYIRSTGDWAQYTPAGRKRRTGFPSAVRLLGDNGYISDVIPVYQRDGDICIIPANAYFAAPRNEVAARAATLDAIGLALAQNLNALKQANAIIYNDPSLKGQITAAENKRLEGAATVELFEDVGHNVRIEKFSPDAQSHIPDFLELWTQTLEELDALTGRTTLGEKSERRIADEVAVIEDSASAAIDVIIDTFNMFVEWYGIDARAERKVKAVYSSVERGVEENPNEEGNATNKDRSGGEEGEKNENCFRLF